MTRTLAFAALLSFVPLSAHATVTRAIEFENKVSDAAAIVVGKCVAQESRWNDTREWILTYSTFQVEKTLKGQPAQQITLVTAGGTVDNITQDVIGVPKFQPGEENVVFVRNSQAGPTVLYLEQGNYKLHKDDRGDRIVEPAITTAVMMDTGRGTAVRAEEPRQLREFESAVRDSVRRREVMRMEMIERQKQEQASLWNQIQRNRVLVALAVLGILLATWQFAKRS
ncbi:MAG TPA: hypothetical protein VND45_07625 [Thermoanaerobaculia bacterium]|jgi:hypothetical protein|nr:hypothetical protein [Thermoanaerobaculia bacterium]